MDTLISQSIPTLHPIKEHACILTEPFPFLSSYVHEFLYCVGFLTLSCLPSLWRDDDALCGI